MGTSRQIAYPSLAFALALFLSGCGGGMMGSDAPAAAPAAAASAVGADALVGSWGLASYQKPEDRSRTEKEAKAQCNKPYVVKRGPNGGVMMHLADQKEPQELVLKAGPGGKTYLGPAGDPGGGDDRLISAVDGKSFTANWIDPDNSARYGTMVYERCGAH
jgi:hypothetical protein